MHLFRQLPESILFKIQTTKLGDQWKILQGNDSLYASPHRKTKFRKFSDSSWQEILRRYFSIYINDLLSHLNNENCRNDRIDISLNLIALQFIFFLFIYLFIYFFRLISNSVIDYEASTRSTNQQNTKITGDITIN